MARGVRFQTKASYLFQLFFQGQHVFNTVFTRYQIGRMRRLFEENNLVIYPINYIIIIINNLYCTFNMQ